MGNSDESKEYSEAADDNFEGDTMKIVLHSEEKPPYEESPELQTLLDTTEREIKRTITADKKREAAKRKTPAVARTTHEITYVSGPTEKSPVGGSGDHATWMRPTDTETIMLSGNAQFALENAEGRLSRRSRHTGLPTRKAWRLGYGDTRVFAKPPKNKGKVVCLVDLSGSMGCWCEACGNESSGGSSGWLAWQTVSVLSNRFPDMEVFGFIGSNTRNYIIPVPSRQQPLCRDKLWPALGPRSESMAGNPDCAAVLWLEGYIGLSSSNAAAIIISDGMPSGPSPVRCDEVAHTREIAHRLHDEGLSYASVLVRTHDSDLYPSEITAYVNKPDDICNLQGVLDWMNQR